MPEIAVQPPVPPLEPGDVPLSILIDYDGTIALTDVSDTITTEFLPPDLERELGEAYVSGRIGSRETMAREVGLLPDDEAAIDRLVASQPHDPGFAPFFARARSDGIPIEVVSDGFGFFIPAAMAALGVEDVTIVTARTTFHEGRPRIEFPNGHPTCFVCGTCKRQRVLAHRASGRAVLFIGDGESDRYAAGYSDFVFAKRALVSICERSGWPYRTWEQFAEIDDWLAAALTAWRESGRPPLTPRPVQFFCGPEVWGEGHTSPPDRTMFRRAPGGESAPIGTDIDAREE